MMFRLLAAFVVLCVAIGGEARAEGRLRIVEQFGTVYLPLHVLRDQKLIEKHGKEAGIDIKVEWTKLSGGAVINDALLSGAVDVGAAGAGPVIVLWDRTKGSADVKIIAALGEQPNYLITNNPNIKTSEGLHQVRQDRRAGRRGLAAVPAPADRGREGTR